MVIRTEGFSRIPPGMQAKMMDSALKRISAKTHFIIFDPACSGERLEDEGGTLRLPGEAGEKVYAILDDYGTPEALREEFPDAPRTARYLVTFMLAREY
jgi:hypothetical protein